MAGPRSVYEPPNCDRFVADMSGDPWASLSRPRKLSPDSSATFFRQPGHRLRCLLTALADGSSSLPRP